MPDFSFNLLKDCLVNISNFVIKSLSINETELRKNCVPFLFIYKDFYIVLPLFLSCSEWDAPCNIVIEFFYNNDGAEKSFSSILSISSQRGAARILATTGKAS